MTATEEPQITFDLSPAAMCNPEQISTDNMEASSFSELNMERFNDLIAGIAPEKKTKVRHENLYPLNVKRVKLTVDHTSIADLVTEISMSIYRTVDSVNNAKYAEISLTDNFNYINKFLLLKRVLLDTGASKSIIKKKNVPAALLNKCKRKSSVEWSTN